MLEDKLEEFERWAAPRQFSSCRLVHYCGVDTPSAIDVPLAQIKDEIIGCLSEGFLVAWEQQGQWVYLAVQEPDCPMPPWEKVFAEEALVDVDRLLREAGFNPDA
ncbi:hypothetical protein F4U02_10930 [Acinetobacter haemolyticus]|nr:hypothetical protein [Acinetobacter haemolyticus]MQZ31498.1 hypothetical protein [Acinetobacter haemolyticus]